MENWRKRYVGTMSFVGEVLRKYGAVSIRLDQGLDNGKEVPVSEFLELCQPTRDCTAFAYQERDPAQRQRGLPNDLTAGISYVWILNDNIPNTSTDIDYSAITTKWKSLTDKFQERKCVITQSTLDELANEFSYKSGKWIFYPKVGEEVDSVWKLVVKGMAEGDLGKVAMAAYAHPSDPRNPGNAIEEYVICIRNEDYTDEHQMNSIVEFLRKGGVKCVLKYKLDIYSHLGIYPDNPYHLMSTIRYNKC